MIGNAWHYRIPSTNAPASIPNDISLMALTMFHIAENVFSSIQSLLQVVKSRWCQPLHAPYKIDEACMTQNIERIPVHTHWHLPLYRNRRLFPCRYGVHSAFFKDLNSQRLPLALDGLVTPQSKQTTSSVPGPSCVLRESAILAFVSVVFG